MRLCLRIELIPPFNMPIIPPICQIGISLVNNAKAHAGFEHKRSEAPPEQADVLFRCGTVCLPPSERKNPKGEWMLSSAIS